MTVKTLEDQLHADLERQYGTCVKRSDVEKILSVSRRMALKLIQDGELESFRLGSHYRVPIRSVARYAAMGATPPKPKG